ncbi:MAG: hypothetical protein J6I49_01800 [Bacteroidales bacterium]|nr:hypothetical protein [Bacteroidales bacterium]
MTRTATLRAVGLTVAVDAVLVAAACLVPAASHAMAYPLYTLNPMFAMLLAGVLVGRRAGMERVNALLLAVAMPLVSHLLVGMPAGDRVFCMMAELAVVAALVPVLARRWHALPAVMVAALAGKVVYYALKALLLAPAVLIGTDWMLQIFALLLWGGLFAMVYKSGK